MLGLKASLVNSEEPLAGDPDGTVVTLRLTLEGVESLSANTTREYSRFFANMAEQITAPVKAKAKPRPIQPALPGL